MVCPAHPVKWVCDAETKGSKNVTIIVVKKKIP